MGTDIRQQVCGAGGLTEITIRDLRDALGWRRVGCRIKEEIESWLSSEQISWLPTELPTPQDSVVILYAHGTLAGDALAAGRRLAEYEGGDEL